MEALGDRHAYRRNWMFARVIALCTVLLFVGCGPLLLLPGGELGGVSASAPDDWAFSDDVSTVQLETRPNDPYSVNIWAVGMGPALYIHAGANRSSWVEHIEMDPEVRIRVGETIYDLRAARVGDQEEFAGFIDAYEQKYSTRPRNENIGQIYLFRLTPR
jgi:hypothetical protein